MIKTEYIEEIIHISNKEKIVNNDLIEKIVLDSVDKCDPLTQSKFSKIEFATRKGNDLNTLAACNTQTGILTCYYESILRDVYEQELSILSSNFRIVTSILHELEHLKEEYKITLNNFESNLIKYGSGDFIFDLVVDKYCEGVEKKYGNFRVAKYILEKKWNLIYDRVWEVCPSEKIAEAETYKQFLKSINDFYGFKKKYSKTYDDIIEWYICSLMLGYDYNKENHAYNIPLQDYLNELKKIDINNRLDHSLEQEISNFENYEIEDRMKYGLPITKQDFIKVKQKYLKH